MAKIQKSKNRDRELFGEVAVRLKLVKPKDVETALKIQQELKQQGKKHKLIGLILLEMGVLDTAGLIAVLKEMESKKELRGKIKER